MHPKIQQFLEKNEKEFDKFDEDLFDFHIRGCNLLDRKTNKICDKRKKEFKIKLKSFLLKSHLSFLKLIAESLPEEGIKWMQEGNNKNRKGFTNGYNQCRQDLKKLLEVEDK